uniref:Uncharacterized protein n=1 Tax=viral metagenome TaxID=1070528 RepID=A0A6M3XSI6_9ZZZZ
MKWTPIAAMAAIVILEAIALLKGIDGAIFGIAIAAIAGLGGYEVKVLRNKVKGDK